MNSQITIASVQMPNKESQKENLDIISSYLNHISINLSQVQLVVFPELAVSSFKRDLENQAESIPGSLTKKFSTFAKKYNLWLVAGSIYEYYDNKIYNSCPVLSPDGSLAGLYRKRYPWDPYEKTHPGQEPLVVDIKDVGKIGIMICYDSWFPEVARELAYKGAELIIIPTMTTTSDRTQEQVLARAMAIAQQCYVVSCNSVGYAGVGGSQIIDPEGIILQDSGSGPVIQTCVIDFTRVRMIRKKGIAGVTNPLKSFWENPQRFSVYDEEGKLNKGSNENHN